MILLLVVWTLMVAGAVSLGMKMSLPAALATWAALTALLCAAGAILMQLQPIGIATPTGRIGSSFVYWGFDVGRGQLIPAAVISWLIWIFLGSAIIALTQFRSQPRHVLMVLAWAVDVACLLYVVGVLATRTSRGLPGSLVLMAVALVGMIAGSAVLWRFVGTERARSAALLLAGGPPLFIGVGYGLFVAVMVIGARGRWN